MAERADARRTFEIPGASHALSVSQPQATLDLVVEAAALPHGRLTHFSRDAKRLDA